MSSYELTKSTIEKLGIPGYVDDPSKEMLRGLAEIAAYLECSISSVRRYILHYSLPVFKFTDRGMPIVPKEILRRWAISTAILELEDLN